MHIMFRALCALCALCTSRLDSNHRKGIGIRPRALARSLARSGADVLHHRLPFVHGRHLLLDDVSVF